MDWGNCIPASSNLLGNHPLWNPTLSYKSPPRLWDVKKGLLQDYWSQCHFTSTVRWGQGAPWEKAADQAAQWTHIPKKELRAHAETKPDLQQPHGQLTQMHIKITWWGTSLVVLWLRLCESTSGGEDSIPGWGTKTPACHVAQPKIK